MVMGRCLYSYLVVRFSFYDSFVFRWDLQVKNEKSWSTTARDGECVK